MQKNVDADDFFPGIISQLALGCHIVEFNMFQQHYLLTLKCDYGKFSRSL